MFVDEYWLTDLSHSGCKWNGSVIASDTSRVARNRWLVAYTLTNNPSLIGMRSTCGTTDDMGFVGGLMTKKKRTRYGFYWDNSGNEHILMEPLLGTDREAEVQAVM